MYGLTPHWFTRKINHFGFLVLPVISPFQARWYAGISHLASKDIKMAARPISVFWFKNRAQYDSCKEVLTDSWVLPDDYRDWLIRFNQMIERYERSGIQVIKIEIEPNEFSVWCLSNGCEISTKSCNDFAVFHGSSNALRDRELDRGYD
ncbi:TPA: hypothetical protein ACTYSP_000496 [Citrobacter freundii]